MKKNKMMRLASAMLMMTLLTTSVISGTFAKYVTTASGSDTARVAKWGVTVAANGTLFDVAYKDTPATFTASEKVDTITVQTSDSAKLVAPGTKNEEGITFTLTGIPEVDTKVEIKITDGNEGETVKEVMLPAGEYRDYTTGDINAKFTVPEGGYYPVVFTLKNGAGLQLVSGKLSEIETYLEALSNTYHTNTNLATIGTNTDGTYQLTWAWDFDANGAGTNDKADTYLGNVAAGLVTDANVVTDIKFAIEISVTQID